MSKSRFSLNHFFDYIKLYGFWFALQRVFKAILHKIFHLAWEKVYMMTRLNGEIIPLVEQNDWTVRELTKEDIFGKPQWEGYYAINATGISDYFNLDFARSYGVFIQDELAYVTWILYDHIDIAGKLIEKQGCAMQWNAYCLPKFRGKGLHSYGKAWAINEMTRQRVNKCYAATLSYNRPALKAQKKLGFAVENIYYVIICGTKKYIKYVK
ncbi:MAG: hypothetical protein IJ724_13610 [Muribaculaceae bacterium]|nr:hypothetical protein [Muribaculaceae bacterium]